MKRMDVFIPEPCGVSKVSGWCCEFCYFANLNFTIVLCVGCSKRLSDN
jgi:hypothetical protein